MTGPRVTHDDVVDLLGAQLPDLRSGYEETNLGTGAGTYELTAPNGATREVRVADHLLNTRSAVELVEQIGQEFKKGGLVKRTAQGYWVPAEEQEPAPPTPGEVADSYRRGTYVGDQDSSNSVLPVPVWILDGLRADGTFILRLEHREEYSGRPTFLAKPEHVDLEFAPDHGPLHRSTETARLRAAVHALEDAVMETRTDVDAIDLWGTPKDDRSDAAQQYADRQVRAAGLRLLRQRGSEIREAFELFDTMMKRVEEAAE